MTEKTNEEKNYFFKNILIQNFNGELKLLTEFEWNQMQENCDDDRFVLVGKLVDKKCTQVSSLYLNELKLALHHANSIIGQLKQHNKSEELTKQINKFNVLYSGVDDPAYDKALAILNILKESNEDLKK